MSEAAPEARVASAPAETATWAHMAAEAALAESQTRDGGAHQSAVLASFPGMSVDSSTPDLIPASPGQAASLDALTSWHMGGMPGQGQ